jgi:hypothetical protein
MFDTQHKNLASPPKIDTNDSCDFFLLFYTTTTTTTMMGHHGIGSPRIGSLALSLLMLSLLSRIDHVRSMTACPMPYDEIQPDGSRVTLLLKGDEYFHIRTDLQGMFGSFGKRRRRKNEAISCCDCFLLGHIAIVASIHQCGLCGLAIEKQVLTKQAVLSCVFFVFVSSFLVLLDDGQVIR